MGFEDGSHGRYRHHFKLHQLNPSSREIRLLRILPGDYQTVLHTHLEHDLLEEAPTYHALSYEWGADDNLQPVTIDGKVVSLSTSFLRTSDTSMGRCKSGLTFCVSTKLIMPRRVIKWRCWVMYTGLQQQHTLGLVHGMRIVLLF